VKIAATIVITWQRVVPAAALEMVRLFANVGSETSTRDRGREDRRDEADGAQAGRRERPAAAASPREQAGCDQHEARSARGNGRRDEPRLLRSCATTTVQATIAMPRSAAGTDRRLLVAAARWQKSPDSRSVRYVAPCASEDRHHARPATTV
jgi:hypothetical protein